MTRNHTSQQYAARAKEVAKALQTSMSVMFPDEIYPAFTLNSAFQRITG